MVPSPTPTRDHGDPQSVGFEAQVKKESWCGRRDLNPHSPCGKTDFLTRLRLSPPLHSTARFGVWTIPSPLSRMYRRGFRCCPSSLYTFPTGFPRKGLARDRHLTGFPEFEQFCIAGFPTSTQVFRLSPLRLPIPPRPRGWLIPGAAKTAGQERSHCRF